MTLHYEDADGNVQELEFKYRLATPQAREQFRACVAEGIRDDKKFAKTAKEINDRLAAAQKTNNETVADKIGVEVVAHNSEADNRSDAMFFKLVRLSCQYDLKPILTDELLASADIEEVREIVTTFRAKLKI